MSNIIVSGVLLIRIVYFIEVIVCRSRCDYFGIFLSVVEVYEGMIL